MLPGSDDQRAHRVRLSARLRRLSLRAMDLALLGGLAARVSYAVGLHGRLRVAHHELVVADGPPLLRPLRVAFASDFHAGLTTDPQMFVRLMEEVARHQPDLLLLGGDYVSSKAAHIGVLAELLSHCTPSLGKYAVLGNHDHWTGAQHITQQLARADVQVLVNRNVALPPPFDQVSICGIDDPWMGRVDVARAFGGAGPIRIFLTHSPDGLCFMRGTRYEVAFAGHTHGGQIALPDGTPLVTVGGPLSKRYHQGRFEISGNGPLIVSRGVGCSNLPIRINADPELILCTVRGATA
jgi:predicted MPP superfamily phosphohydrolase